MGKPILCLDFDGVIHSYNSGWKGADVIPDDPVKGASTFIMEALGHFDVQVYSSRSGQQGGINAMQEYLIKRVGLSENIVLEVIGWPDEKPPAMITIDDRALTFVGRWPAIADLKKFKPWNKGGIAKQELFELPDGTAVCCNPGGRFHGWLFRRHPDGQMISVRKLEEASEPSGHVEFR